MPPLRQPREKYEIRMPDTEHFQLARAEVQCELPEDTLQLGELLPLAPRALDSKVQPARRRCDGTMPSVAKQRNIASIRSGGSFAPPVKPPSQYGHVGANDILDDKFARDHVRRIIVDGGNQFVAHQI